MSSSVTSAEKEQILSKFLFFNDFLDRKSVQSKYSIGRRMYYQRVAPNLQRVLLINWLHQGRCPLFHHVVYGIKTLLKTLSPKQS